MNKYKTYEELKEELGDKFEEYMYKANIELLTKIDKAIEYINENYDQYEKHEIVDDKFCCMTTRYEHKFKKDKLIKILQGEDKMKLKELQKTNKRLFGIDILKDKKEMIYQKDRKVEVLYKATYKGYTFYVLSLGTHPTAYVKLPVGHPYYFKDYNDIDIDVHGGLTYSSDHLFIDVGVSIEGWFIGWDYAHWGDYIGYFIDDEILSKDNDKQKKWTTDEIIQECLDVIEQLEKVRNEIK